MYKIANFGPLLPNNGYVVRLSDDAVIPPDPDNTDYQQYLKWVAQGNEPLPAEEPVAPASTAAADEGVA